MNRRAELVSVHVRVARPQDAEAIATALLDAGQQRIERAGVVQNTTVLTGNDRPQLVARADAAIRENQDGARTLLVAQLDGHVAGYAHVHWVPVLFLPGLEGYVTELFVAAADRGRGCGSALLERIKALAEERNAARLFLVNGRQSTAYEREFYRKHGFTEAAHLAPFRRELRDR